MATVGGRWNKSAGVKGKTEGGFAREQIVSLEFAASTFRGPVYKT